MVAEKLSVFFETKVWHIRSIEDKNISHGTGFMKSTDQQKDLLKKQTNITYIPSRNSKEYPNTNFLELTTPKSLTLMATCNKAFKSHTHIHTTDSSLKTNNDIFHFN